MEASVNFDYNFFKALFFQGIIGPGQSEKAGLTAAYQRRSVGSVRAAGVKCLAGRQTDGNALAERRVFLFLSARHRFSQPVQALKVVTSWIQAHLSGF